MIVIVLGLLTLTWTVTGKPTVPLFRGLIQSIFDTKETMMTFICEIDPQSEIKQ